jgi:hypothetical protein
VKRARARGVGPLPIVCKAGGTCACGRHLVGARGVSASGRVEPLLFHSEFMQVLSNCLSYWCHSTVSFS